MKNLLVTGANGQLGNELRNLEKQFRDFNFIFASRDILDVTNSENLNNFFTNTVVDYCINGAAYTAVDTAEEDVDYAFLLNAESVKHLSTACEINDTKLIHISTDFVFDGKSKIALKESDKTNPLSTYGSSKLKGEDYALEANHLVIRTSWLYSTFGNNFVKTMLRLGADRDELNIIADQIGTPTYAKDLAEIILDLISNQEKSDLNGLYHFSNDGKASWFDFATEIFNVSGVKCKTNPIPTTEYPTPAERPKFSLMDKSKIVKDFDIELKDWKDSLKECIQKLNKSES